MIGSRSMLSRVTEEAAAAVGAAAGGTENPAGGGLPPYPALVGPFRTDNIPTAPLRFTLRTVMSDDGVRAPRNTPAPGLAPALAPSLAAAVASSAAVSAAHTHRLDRTQPTPGPTSPPLAG
ncbi:hypothetical protein ND748_23850 [Frankia sp. AiPs1]|nr:hypothetical protein [Frankia sp. AiPs1]